ncbi:unnamed protein product, partial [Onchocerca flexuosa]|uniref:Transmembrane protein n=1 Tax=Onchocerca flexuosa TaxID=387005 RepID=A0A183HR31_9BILA
MGLATAGWLLNYGGIFYLISDCFLSESESNQKNGANERSSESKGKVSESNDNNSDDEPMEVDIVDSETKITESENR